MREALPEERAIGMGYYASDADGTGGRLRDQPEDFRVAERETVDLEPLTADASVFDHLVVRVTLRGWETNEFASTLSNRLGMSRERVAWAGTKDKQAVTTQLVSLARVAPDDLPAIDGVDLEPVGRLGRPLRFGDLGGNAFEVVVRDAERPNQADPVTGELQGFAGEGDSPSAVTPIIGVPNYFGHQRFGSIRPVTHLVGRRIVEGDWEGAVMTYLGGPTDEEPPATRSARQFVEDTRDWAAAAERFPAGLSFERALCHRLAETGGETEDDFKAALEALPSTLQRLFVHAAQSEVFNYILSRRLERGLPFDRAVPGDIVCFGEPAGELVVPDPDRTQRITADRVDTVNRHITRGRAFVTAPLVGTETALAAGDPGEVDRSVLADLELTPEDFALTDPYASTGTRRAIGVRTAMATERDPLTFSFALPPGSYATVVLREYLKVGPDAL